MDKLIEAAQRLKEIKTGAEEVKDKKGLNALKLTSFFLKKFSLYQDKIKNRNEFEKIEKDIRDVRNLKDRVLKLELKKKKKPKKDKKRRKSRLVTSATPLDESEYLNYSREPRPEYHEGSNDNSLSASYSKMTPRGSKRPEKLPPAEPKPLTPRKDNLAPKRIDTKEYAPTIDDVQGIQKLHANQKKRLQHRLTMSNVLGKQAIERAAQYRDKLKSEKEKLKAQVTMMQGNSSSGTESESDSEPHIDTPRNYMPGRTNDNQEEWEKKQRELQEELERQRRAMEEEAEKHRRQRELEEAQARERGRREREREEEEARRRREAQEAEARERRKRQADEDARRQRELEEQMAKEREKRLREQERERERARKLREQEAERQRRELERQKRELQAEQERARKLREQEQERERLRRLREAQEAEKERLRRQKELEDELARAKRLREDEAAREEARMRDLMNQLKAERERIEAERRKLQQEKDDFLAKRMQEEQERARRLREAHQEELNRKKQLESQANADLEAELERLRRNLEAERRRLQLEREKNKQLLKDLQNQLEDLKRNNPGDIGARNWLEDEIARLRAENDQRERLLNQLNLESHISSPIKGSYIGNDSLGSSERRKLLAALQESQLEERQRELEDLKNKYRKELEDLRNQEDLMRRENERMKLDLEKARRQGFNTRKKNNGYPGSNYQETRRDSNNRDDGAETGSRAERLAHLESVNTSEGPSIHLEKFSSHPSSRLESARYLSKEEKLRSVKPNQEGDFKSTETFGGVKSPGRNRISSRNNHKSTDSMLDRLNNLFDTEVSQATKDDDKIPLNNLGGNRKVNPYANRRRRGGIFRKFEHFNPKDANNKQAIVEQFRKAKGSGANMADVYIELIALFLQKALDKRKKKKMDKYNKRNLKRMARQLYLVGTGRVKAFANLRNRNRARYGGGYTGKYLRDKSRKGRSKTPVKSGRQRINPPMVFGVDSYNLISVKPIKAGLVEEDEPGLLPRGVYDASPRSRDITRTPRINRGLSGLGESPISPISAVSPVKSRSRSPPRIAGVKRIDVAGVIDNLDNSPNKRSRGAVDSLKDRPPWNYGPFSPEADISDEDARKKVENFKDNWREGKQFQYEDALGEGYESYYSHQKDQLERGDTDYMDDHELDQMKYNNYEEFHQYLPQDAFTFKKKPTDINGTMPPQLNFNYPNENDFWKTKLDNNPMVNYIRFNEKKLKAYSKLNRSKDRFSDKPYFSTSGVEKGFFSHPIHRIKAACISPTSTILNLITVNNILLRVSLESGAIKKFYKVYQLKNRLIDGFVEDHFGRVYASAGKELFVYQILNNAIKFDDYVVEQNRRLPGFRNQGNWVIKHKRLFYDGVRRRAIWWKSLTEIFLIDSETRKHLEPRRIDVSSKLRVIHGNFTAYMCYSQEKDFVSMVVFQKTLSSYVLFTLNMRDRTSGLVLNNFGAYGDLEPTCFDFRDNMIVIAGVLRKGPRYRLTSSVVSRIQNSIQEQSVGVAVDFYKVENSGFVSMLSRKYVDKDEENPVRRILINDKSQAFCLLGDTAILFNILNDLEVSQGKVLHEIQPFGNEDFIALDYRYKTLISVGTLDRSVSLVRSLD